MARDPKAQVRAAAAWNANTPAATLEALAADEEQVVRSAVAARLDAVEEILAAPAVDIDDDARDDTAAGADAGSSGNRRPTFLAQPPRRGRLQKRMGPGVLGGPVPEPHRAPTRTRRPDGDGLPMGRLHRVAVCARQLILHNPPTAERWDRLRPRGIGDLNNARRGAPQMLSSAGVACAVVSATKAAWHRHSSDNVRRGWCRLGQDALGGNGMNDQTDDPGPLEASPNGEAMNERGGWGARSARRSLPGTGSVLGAGCNAERGPRGAPAPPSTRANVPPLDTPTHARPTGRGANDR